MPHNKIKILVTRSKQKSEDCAQLFSNLGFEPVIYPCIHYEPSNKLDSFMGDYNPKLNDSWIFVSPTAVDYFSRHSGAKSIISSVGTIFAIGESTANKIRSSFNVNAIYPTVTNSESFILLPELEAALNNKFYIARAQSGRDKIKSFISEMGASVKYVETYRTIFVTKEEISTMINILKERKVNCIVITSFELLKHIVSHFEVVNELDLIQRRVITVVNKRMYNWATRMGFANIIELPAVDNQSIVRSVTNYYKGSLNV
jgi:uroporphyrinogen-III synthase